jgi:hypothetical protein
MLQARDRNTGIKVYQLLVPERLEIFMSEQQQGALAVP